MVMVHVDELPFLKRLVANTAGIRARVLPLALHELGCFARSAVARRARTHGPLSRHPLTAQILPHTPRVDSGFSDFCRDTPTPSHSPSLTRAATRSWNQ